MSLEGSQSPVSSPSPSSSSDDFAALLDAELLNERQSTPDVLEEDRNLMFPELDIAENSSGVEEESSGEGSDTEEEQVNIDIQEDEGEQLHVEGAGLPVEDLRYDGSRKRKLGDVVDIVDIVGLSADSEMGSDVKCPPHPGFIWDVCIRCGERKSTTPTNEPVQAQVALRYIHEGLEVSEQEASRVRLAELKRVTGRKKLLLVVDLDHTMLNSARFSEVPPDERAYLSAAYFDPNPACSSAATVGLEQGRERTLHQLPRLGMWTKLRPFAHKFLEEASKLYEMYVYTMGERVYALAMAQLLDPAGSLFGDRIISQGDSTKRNTKDLDVVLGAESAVVILDDTEGVWPNHKANLILMERYHFFTSSCLQFGVKALSLAQLHRDESEAEGTLATTLRILRAIHRNYFYGHMVQGVKQGPLLGSPDVRQVIRSIHYKVLAGCNVVFSRIFQTGLAHPERHPFWQLTEELGAQCSPSCDRTTTHVVALDRGTDKARWAKQNGVFLVHPSWVEAAQYLWHRPPEKDYPVTDDSSGYALTTFAKNIMVEPKITDLASDNGEARAALEIRSHNGVTATKAGTHPQNSLASPDSAVEATELPSVHANGSRGAASDPKA